MNIKICTRSPVHAPARSAQHTHCTATSGINFGMKSVERSRRANNLLLFTMRHERAHKQVAAQLWGVDHMPSSVANPQTHRRHVLGARAYST